MNSHAALPPVPLVDVGIGGALALYRAAPEIAQAQIDDAEARFTRLGVRLADARSRRWLTRNGNPLADEIAAVHEAAGRPGAWLLNLSYEWGCSTAVAADPAGQGMRLLRTLDWPFHGLGAGLLAARMSGPAGPWLNLTWPGFAGVLTAVCPGRFAIAFNQTPMRARRLGPLRLPMIADWALNRMALARDTALPPAHLLRLICDEAPDYATARRRLAETPLATSCFVALSGVGPGEGCVVERLEREAAIHDAPAAVTNHWLTPGRTGHSRTRNTRERLAAIEEAVSGTQPLAWVVPPVLNADTRLAAELNAATGRVVVQGFEPGGAVTRPTVVEA